MNLWGRDNRHIKRKKDFVCLFLIRQHQKLWRRETSQLHDHLPCVCPPLHVWINYVHATSHFTTTQWSSLLRSNYSLLNYIDPVQPGRQLFPVIHITKIQHIFGLLMRKTNTFLSTFWRMQEFWLVGCCRKKKKWKRNNTFQVKNGAAKKDSDDSCCCCWVLFFLTDLVLNCNRSIRQKVSESVFGLVRGEQWMKRSGAVCVLSPMYKVWDDNTKGDKRRCCPPAQTRQTSGFCGNPMLLPQWRVSVLCATASKRLPADTEHQTVFSLSQTLEQIPLWSRRISKSCLSWK